MNYIQIALLATIILLLLRQQKAATGSIVRPSGKSKKMVLDSCALIDGRIVELTKLGFVPDELIVPEFVVHELQLLADGNDSHKRERARYGLDVVKELQGSDNATVSIDPTDMGRQPTDDKLVALASKLNAGLYTTDYNLNKVADIKGVQVLNVNELAQQLRPTALPGERKTVKILQKGSNPKQGVGYLDDGTMIVVDDAANQVNKIIEVEVTRIHQTMAGKMLFANLIKQPQQQGQTKGRTPQPQQSGELAQRLRKRPERRSRDRQ